MGDAQKIKGGALTLEPAARYLGGIPTRTLRFYAKQRRIPYVRIGRRLAFLRSDLDAFLNAGRVEARTE